MPSLELVRLQTWFQHAVVRPSLPVEAASPALALQYEGEESTMNDVFDNNQPNPDLPAVALPTGQQSVVRLELLLTPDQLSNLFRAVAANQHSLWTLKDAAAYLRISSRALAQLAEEGSVPGFLVDGRWRFAKTSVDEWLQSTAVMKEAA